MALNNHDIQVLLDDVGRFLEESLGQETLSVNTQIQRNGLIQRLKPYTGDKSYINGAVTPQIILPLRTAKGEQEDVTLRNLEEDYEEPGSIIESRPSSSSTSSSGQSECSIKIFPTFMELKSATSKCGPLFQKEKVVFLDQWKKYWAGIYEHFLLLYNSDRDMKPVHTLNIQGYVARAAPNCIKDLKKKNAAFEIVCPGKKEYQFVARTMKDMEQWIAAICQASVHNILVSTPGVQHQMSHSAACISKPRTKIPPPNPSEDSQSMKIPNDFNVANDDENGSSEEEIYHEIPELLNSNSQTNNKQKVKVVEEGPPLPPRRPLPSIPKDESDEELYDDVGVSDHNGTYLNANMMNVQGNKTDIQMSEKLEFKNEEEKQEEEEIYDDVGIQEEQCDKINLPVVTPKTSEDISKPPFKPEGVVSKPQVTAYKPSVVPKPPTAAPKPPTAVPKKPPPAIPKPPEFVTKPQFVPKPSEKISKPPEEISKPPKEISKPPEEISKSPEKISNPPEEISKPPEEISKPPEEISKPPVGVTKNAEGNKSSLQHRIKLLEAHLQNGNMPLGGHIKNQKVPDHLKSNKSYLHEQETNSIEETNQSILRKTEAADTLPKDTFINESQSNKSNLIKPINSNEGETKFRTRPSVPPPKPKLSNEDQPNKSSLFKLVNNSASNSGNQTPSLHSFPKFPNKIQTTPSKLHNKMNETEAKSNHSPFSIPNSSQPPELPPRSYLKR